MPAVVQRCRKLQEIDVAIAELFASAPDVAETLALQVPTAFRPGVA